MSTIAGVIKTIAYKIRKTLKWAALGISAAFTYITYAFGSFEKAMRKATAVSDVTEAQFRKMAGMARAEAIRLNLDARQAADAFYYLGSAGLSVKEQMEAFIPVMTLVKAGVGEVGETAENVVDIIKGFQLSFSQTAHVTDVLAKAATTANATLPQFAAALKEVAGIGQMTHNTLEELTSAMAMMADVGFKGRRAGFMLRRILVRLMAPMSDVTKLLNEYNMSIYDTEGKMKPFVQIVGELSDAMKGAGEEARNMAFKTIFGQRAIAGQIAIFNKGKDALDKYTQSLIDSGGTAQKVADKQMNSLLEQFGRWRKMLKDVFISIGKYLSPALRMLLSDLQKNTEATGKFVKDNEFLITEWALKIASKIIFVKDVMKDFLVGMVKNWPETWKYLTDVSLASMKVFWESFKITGKSGLGLIVENFIALGKSLVAIWDKVATDLSNLWETKFKKRVYETSFSLLAEGSPLFQMLKVLDPMAAKGIKEYLKGAGAKAAGEPDIMPTRTWRQLKENIKSFWNTAFNFAITEAKRVEKEIAELQEKAFEGITKPKWMEDIINERLFELHTRWMEIVSLIDKLQQEGDAATGKAAGAAGGGVGGDGGPGGGFGSRIGFVGLREAWATMARSLQPKDRVQDAILAENRLTNKKMDEQTGAIRDIDTTVT